MTYVNVYDSPGKDGIQKKEDNKSVHFIGSLWPLQPDINEALPTPMKSPSLRIQRPPSISMPTNAPQVRPAAAAAAPPSPPQLPARAPTKAAGDDLHVLRSELMVMRLERDDLLAEKLARQLAGEFSEVNPLPLALQRKEFEAKARLDSETIQNLAAERAFLAETLRAAQAESRTRNAAEMQDKAAKVADKLRQLEAENTQLWSQVTVAKGLADASKELVSEKQRAIADLEGRLRIAEQQDKGTTLTLMLDNANLEIMHLNDLVAAKQAQIDELQRDHSEHVTKLAGAKAMVDAAHEEVQRMVCRTKVLEEQLVAHRQQQDQHEQTQQQQEQKQPPAAATLVVTEQPSEPPAVFRTQAAVATGKNNVLSSRIAAMEAAATEDLQTIQRLQAQLTAAEAKKPLCC